MCGIAGLINHRKKKENGARIRKGIVLQNDRGNGLGAGYAAYGIYPDYADQYALHVMARDAVAMKEVSSYLNKHFRVAREEKIPVWNEIITDHPLFNRFFVEPRHEDKMPAASLPENAPLDNGVQETEGISAEPEHGHEPKPEQGQGPVPGYLSDDDYTIEHVMAINSQIEGAYVSSCGKNLGVFKGVGTPADIYDFFKLDDYEGYTWLAHNRFPTNTPGWWGGAHPFNLLDWSIVHNGEISSYGINRRYLEAYGYICNMQTDSEVVAYLLDLLIRKHGLSVFDSTLVLAPPYWATTRRMTDRAMAAKLTALKIIYESAMLNGPFAILSGFEQGMFSITDNTKLRPMTVGQDDKGEYSYYASEVAALYEMEDSLSKVFTPRAGQPHIVYFDTAEEKIS